MKLAVIFFLILALVGSARGFQSVQGPPSRGGMDKKRSSSFVDLSSTHGLLNIRPTASSSFSTMPTSLAAKRTNGNDDNKKEDTSIIDIIKEKPGTLLAAPFVVILGLDLVLNIVFLVKRTFEYYAFGKLPSTEVWVPDNFFL